MKYEVYCDESCWEALFNKDSHEFVVLGGIWICADNRNDIKAYIKGLKQKYNIHGELKWNRVCPSTFELYEELISYFFDNDFIRFRSICIKASEVNNAMFNGGNGELGFYKFYFQLLNKWITGDNTYSIFIDHKINGNQHRIQDLGRYLEYTSIANIAQIQALPSEESLLIQFADILTGVVATSFNNKIKSKAKLDIISLIKKKLGHDIQATNPSEPKFNVFRINLRRGW